MFCELYSPAASFVNADCMRIWFFIYLLIGACAGFIIGRLWRIEKKK